uniref:Uncharacterized protein n=1 Tax=Sciurus vulgaris TaxID=55149 RepID=A0A8D2AKX8_SCIVU
MRDQKVVPLSQEMDAGIQAWQLRQQKLQEEKRKQKHALKPKGASLQSLLPRQYKTIPVPYLSLSLAFFSITWLSHPRQKRAFVSYLSSEQKSLDTQKNSL